MRSRDFRLRPEGSSSSQRQLQFSYSSVTVQLQFSLLDIQDFIAWGARKTDKTNVGKRELVLERGVEAELGESCWSSCWDVQAS